MHDTDSRGTPQRTDPAPPDSCPDATAPRTTVPSATAPRTTAPGATDPGEAAHQSAEPAEGPLEWATVPELVRAAATRHADREAVIEGRTRVNYAELGERIERTAAACIASGLKTGDRVAIWAPNTLDWIVSALGAVTAGGVLVPVNTRFKGAEAAYVLQRTRARLLFVTGTFLGTSYVASLRRATAEGDGSGPLPGLPHLRDVVVLADDAPDDLRSQRDFLAAGDTVSTEEVRRRAATVRPGDPSDITFTSGTTGHPKGAVITHDQTLRVYRVWSDVTGLREGDRYLIVNPFFHTFGYKAGVIACLMRGATMIPQPVFNIDTALAHIATERVSILPGPPTLHRSILDHPSRHKHDLSTLRVVVTGAAVVPLELVERLRSELQIATVLTAYGLTEASGTVTMCRRGDPAHVIAETSGRAIPGTEVRVVASDGTEQAPGRPGEVLVRGYHVMSGYFEEPAETARAITPDGWLRTGDVGVLDADGNLRITDRIKDVVIVGGFNAYPAEIEKLLLHHPDIADVAVIGVPDGRLGEVCKAFAVRHDGATATADDLMAWSRREMANYKVPRQVEFVTELPRNASGKVLKTQLRARG